MVELPFGSPSEHTFVAPDGSTRAPHYGQGEQPWDAIVRLSWAPQFAAGNVINYLRRTKDVADSRRKAVWYFRELAKLAVADSGPMWVDASLVLCALLHELTHDELNFLRSDQT